MHCCGAKRRCTLWSLKVIVDVVQAVMKVMQHFGHVGAVGKMDGQFGRKSKNT